MNDPFAPFEQIFADLVSPEPEGAGPLAAAPPLPPEAEAAVRAALALFVEGLYARSRDALGEARDLAAQDTRAAALVAAHQAFATGRLQPAIQRCLALLETRQHLADLYGVLGVLLLKSRQRTQAHAAFRSGLALAPAHPGLQRRLAEMGTRRSPVLSFLPRSHRANRWLGRVRAWLGERAGPPLAP